MNNICVVNVNWLGDAIFSTPVFKALKKTYPQARVVCVCVPRVKEVMERCPYVDQVIVYDEQGKHFYPWAKLSFVWLLRKARFDAAFILHRSSTRAFLVFLAGIPLRIGFSKHKGLLTHPIPPPGLDQHRSDGYLNVLEGFGIKVDDRRCELRLLLEDMQAMDTKLTEAGIGEAEDFVVINPGGNWNLKRWPASMFAQLIARLYHEFGFKSVLSGAPKDKAYADGIASDAGVPSVVMAGATTLGQSLALYKRARGVISSDTGPLHLAHSVGADVIGIFGPTRPEITGPRGNGQAHILFKEIGCNRAPCYHLACRDNACVQQVTVEDVCVAFRQIIN